MATKKVRKFGAGDLVTGAGAVLVGKYLLDKFREGKGKDDEESDYAKKVREFRDKKAAEPAPEPAKKEEDKPMSREEYLSKKTAPIKETGTFKGPDTAEPDLEYKSKSVVKTTPKKAAPTAPAKKEPVASESSNTTPLTYYTPKAKKAEPVAKPYPQAEATARLKKAEAERRTGQGLTPRAEYTGIGSRKHIEGLKLERSQKLEEEAKKQFEKNKRENEANKGMKRGGMVKKYASGGKPEPKKDTMPDWAKNERANRKQDELNKREAEGARKEVKRNMSTFGFKKGGSASSRADGIAIRGKTRA